MDKEESGDEEVADEFPGLMLVDQSPFAHDFHLDGFNWEELTVRITFDSAVERFEVHEDHSIVATKDGLERVGFVMFPASFFVAAGKEMLDDGGGLFGRGWRRPDTIGHLSDDIAIRTIWLEHPHVSGERIHVTRTYLLQPDACCYVLAPLAPVKRLGIRLSGSGEPGDNAGELMSWVIPGILPQFVPQLIAEYPFDPDTSQSSEATFQPQHYC